MATGSVPPSVGPPGAPAPMPPPPPPRPKAPSTPVTKGAFEVELPAGGRLQLQDADEVVYWEETSKRYIQDYALVKMNDLVMLGAILSQGVAMYRAQKSLFDPKKATNAVAAISKASEQIQQLEKALGIDKKTREAGGQHTTADYVTTLKRAGHAMGVKIAERTKAYEAFTMELRWKCRLLRNGDEEDKAYHNITAESVVAWAENELARLEAEDKRWAHEKGRVFTGRL